MTRDNLGISAREAFGLGGGHENRIAYIVERLLSAAYPALPIQTDQLRRALSPAEVGKIFEGYFNRDARTAEKTATRNYGVALGLSHRDRPEHFAPQPQATTEETVFGLIDKMLAERKGNELPVWQLYDKLSAPPYGLPYAVIQLYLLAFVRHGSPRVDLLLKSQHNLQTRAGQPLNRDRLTASSVAELAWKAGLENKFDALVPSVGPHWNDVLPYARELVDDLKATTDQAEIEREFHRLAQATEKLRTEVSAQQRNLEALAGGLGTSLPAATTETLTNLTQLVADEPASYADFYEQAETIFAAPELLRERMQRYTTLRELTGVAAEISNAKRYLDEVSLRDADRELAADRFTIVHQLQLESLIDDPAMWHRLRNDLDRFKARYRNEYQKHHRDYHTAIGRLRDSLADAPHQLEALSLLNSIESLGQPVGLELAATYRSLEQRLKPCSITEVTNVKVDHQPTCPECSLRLSDQPPEQQVKDFVRAVKEALNRKTRQLAGEAVSRVLAKGDRADLDIFLRAVQASDLAALVDVMSPDLAGFIERLLAEESILTAETGVLAQLAQEYPSLEEREIESVVNKLRQLLQQAFAEAKGANPGKKTIRLTLR